MGVISEDAYDNANEFNPTGVAQQHEDNNSPPAAAAAIVSEDAYDTADAEFNNPANFSGANLRRQSFPDFLKSLDAHDATRESAPPLLDTPSDVGAAIPEFAPEPAVVKTEVPSGGAESTGFTYMDMSSGTEVSEPPPATDLGQDTIPYSNATLFPTNMMGSSGKRRRITAFMIVAG